MLADIVKEHQCEGSKSARDGIYLVNPGSVRQGSYAVIDITDSGIMPVLMKIRY